MDVWVAGVVLAPSKHKLIAENSTHKKLTILGLPTLECSEFLALLLAD